MLHIVCCNFCRFLAASTAPCFSFKKTLRESPGRDQDYISPKSMFFRVGYKSFCFTKTNLMNQSCPGLSTALLKGGVIEFIVKLWQNCSLQHYDKICNPIKY